MKTTIILILVFIVTGCASVDSYVPVIDMVTSTGNQSTLQFDLNECRHLAKTRAGAVENAVIGTAVGSALGAGIGVASSLIFGDDLGTGAAAGALFGGIGGALGGLSVDEQKDIVINCLRARGWNVVGR